MSENRDYTEAQLIELLRQGLDSTDPVPTDVTDFAMAALSWRTIDAELAAIAFDSASEEMPAGVRGSVTDRMLSYETERLSIDIEYRPATRGSSARSHHPSPQQSSFITRRAPRPP